MTTRPIGKAASGYTVLELILVSALVTVVAGMAVPLATDSIDDARASAAARHVASRILLARAQAARRSASVAVRFEQQGDDYVYTTFLDGNRNGVLSRDIRSGIDAPITPSERIGQQFPGVRFGVLPGVSPIEPGEHLSEADDPIRAGSANMLTFGADGSGTSGTVYVRGRRRQTAVRVLGTTGRVRALSYDFASHRWSAP